MDDLHLLEDSGSVVGDEDFALWGLDLHKVGEIWLAFLN